MEENPMLKFVTERQYLVPMYQHILVEAETFEMACVMAVTDDIAWDSQEMDCDNARATTISTPTPPPPPNPAGSPPTPTAQPLTRRLHRALTHLRLPGLFPRFG
jgi:hypothetical protein